MKTKKKAAIVKSCMNMEQEVISYFSPHPEFFFSVQYLTFFFLLNSQVYKNTIKVKF